MFELFFNKCKVVFVINCVEILIMIFGIRYVIDIGMVKERKYDLKRNKSLLEVIIISKSFVE